MAARHHATCPLCEATCGIAMQVEAGRVFDVRGDPADLNSRGYLCAKAAALPDIHHDPDRLTRPLIRAEDGWREADWPEALALAAALVSDTLARHGPDATALYMGNPTLHNWSASLCGMELARALGTRNLFSTASVDHQPHLHAAWLAFGNKALQPVPDLDRTDFLLLIATNPMESNGSMVSAPDFPGRLRALRARGGTLAVVDPRRTRTAEIADIHLRPRPGSDVHLLAAMLHVILAERHDRPPAWLDGRARLADALAAFTPEAAAAATGVPAPAIRQLARDFAGAERAVAHARLGLSTQAFGGLGVWLVLALNALTGNLDRVGGACFPEPPVDLARMARLHGEQGGVGRWHSRVRGAPEVCGELPLAVLAEEIATPGPGQVRTLITVAGNPVLSAPGGDRLAAALDRLDALIAVDFYLNETTRHARVILPPPGPLERPHYDLILHAISARNVARWSPPAVAPAAGRPDEGTLLLTLARAAARGRRSWGRRVHLEVLRRLGPRRVLALLIRFGPYGPGLGLRRRRRADVAGQGDAWLAAGRLTLRRLARAGRTIDLGALRGGRLPELLPGRSVDLLPASIADDLARAEGALRTAPVEPGELLLIGRREARSNNSWMHNARSLAKGRRGTLQVHPADARARGIDGHAQARLVGRDGRAITVALEVTDRVPEGVISLPHGYGHDRAGVRLSVASRHTPGVSVNDVTDPARLDPLTGTAVLNGIPMRVQPSPGARGTRTPHPAAHLIGDEAAE